MPTPSPFPQAYLFTSRTGMTCVFFLSGDDFVFVGDNTTSTAM